MGRSYINLSQPFIFLFKFIMLQRLTQKAVHMKQTLLFMLLLSCFCRAQAQGEASKTLVQQLQVLKTAVLKEDKQAVALFFQFPVKDANLIRKIEGFEKEKLSTKKADRKYFLKHYHRLFTPEVVEMFRQLDVSKLKEQAELIVEVPAKNEQELCTRTYEMVFINNQVTLSYVINTRQDKTITAEAYCEEFAEFWQFSWVGGRLRFHSLEMAG